MLLINIFVLSLLFWRLYTFLACSSSDVSGEPTSEDSGSLQDSLPQISAVAAYSKGFACSSSPGVVLLFEKTNKEVYKESQEIWVGEKKNFCKQLQSRCLFLWAGGLLLIQLLIIILSTTLKSIISMSLMPQWCKKEGICQSSHRNSVTDELLQGSSACTHMWNRLWGC